MALSTVADFISAARVLLQDTYAGAYRYTDAELVAALNSGMMEAARIRPDLFYKSLRDNGTSFASYTSSAPADVVAIDMRYRQGLVYYIVGQAQLRDQEDAQDTRAVSFVNKFTNQLLNVAG